MSDGKKAWAEDQEEKAAQEHIRRLHKLGYSEIAGRIDEAHYEAHRLRESDPTMTRWQHDRLESILNILRKLL